MTDPDRTVRLGDLVDAQRISELIKRDSASVRSWARRYPDYPAEVIVLGGAKGWLWPEVRAWAIERWPELADELPIDAWPATAGP